jgi:hypothetical protein
VEVGQARTALKVEEMDESATAAGILEAGDSVEEFAHRRRRIRLPSGVLC